MSTLECKYPEIAKEWHTFKNSEHPSDIKAHSHKKAWWICSKGHEWQAVVNNRTSNGNGCPYCSGRKFTISFADAFPHLVHEWHERNEEKPNQVARTSHKKVWWKCLKGHEWQANISNRARNHKCPYCTGNKVSLENSLSYQKTNLAAEWHPTKNGDLKPDHVNKSSKHYVWWVCAKCEHEWQATINNRYDKGANCPKCCMHGTSKPELRIWSELAILFGEKNVHHRHKKFGFELDIFVEPVKVGVEYDGLYWHLNESEKDKLKYENCKKLGLPLIRISEINSPADYLIKSEKITKEVINNICDFLYTIDSSYKDKFFNYKKNCDFIGEHLFNREINKRIKQKKDKI